MKSTYDLWYRRYYGYVEVDKSVRPYLEIGAVGPSLRAARAAQFLSAVTMAKRMKIRRSIYSEFEEAETRGTVSLNNLKRCAEAMGCEVIYAVRPKSRRLFSAMIWEMLVRETGREDPNIVQVLLQMFDGRVRRKFGWGRPQEVVAAEYRKLNKQTADLIRSGSVVHGLRLRARAGE